MNDLAPILEQVRLFAAQHMPADVHANAIAVAIGSLVAGIGLSVLGARLSRFAFASAFVGLGAVAGYCFARASGLPVVLCAPVGAAMIGVIGHLTFRLWVGVAVAVVLSSLVLATFGYQHVVPYAAEFDQTHMVAWSPTSGATEVGLPTPERQQEYIGRDPRTWVSELWAYVTSKDADLEQRATSLAIAALVTGLFLGVVAVRWALILTTSLTGTVLVTTGIATLFAHLVPGSYRSFVDHPGVMGVAVGAFLVTSLVLQTMLTRRPPSRASADSDAGRRS